MTDKEILRACEMRLEGKTWAQIGAVLGYHHSSAEHAISRRIFSGKGTMANSIHPNVQRWMREEGVYGKHIAAEAGVCRDTVTTHLNQQVIGKRVAEAICRMSGLTMEQVQALE